jgi:hypothetical protein
MAERLDAAWRVINRRIARTRPSSTWLKHYSKPRRPSTSTTPSTRSSPADFGSGAVRCSIAATCSIFDEIALQHIQLVRLDERRRAHGRPLDLANLATLTATASITRGGSSTDGARVRESSAAVGQGDRRFGSEFTTVQTDGFARHGHAADRAIWGRPYQVRVTTTDPGGTDYLANWWDYHKSAIDSAPISRHGSHDGRAAPARRRRRSATR